MSFFIGVFVFVVIIIIFFILFNTQEAKDNKRDFLLRLSKLDDFNPTQYMMEDNGRQGLAIDEDKNKFCITRDSNGYVITEVYEYKELLEAEILEDGNSITKTSRTGQVGGALLGGILLGGVGAIIGGLSSQKNHIDKVSSLDLKLTVNNTNSPMFIVNFFKEDKGLDKNDYLYKDYLEKARKWHSLMRVIIEQADAHDNEENKVLEEQEKTNNSSMSIADEIKKLKTLLDEGILSDEEFYKLKSKILNNDK